MRATINETSFPFVKLLSASARRELGALAPSLVRSKQRLLQRGDAAHGLYLVVAGSLRVYYISAEGRDVTLYRVEPGGTCILALTAAFNADPYPAWVDAGSEPTSYVCIPSEVARRLLSVEPAFRDFVFSALSGRLFDLMQTLEELGSAQIEQRVARYLARKANDDTVRVTQAEIASELGTAREVVSRALRSLVSRGLVKTARLRIEVLDLGALLAIADPPNTNTPRKARR